MKYTNTASPPIDLSNKLHILEGVQDIGAGYRDLFQDITDVKLTENALQESENRYRQLVQGVPCALYTCDANGRITLFNKAASDLWGREPQIGVDYWCGSWKIYKPNGDPLPLESCPMAVALKEGRPVLDEEIIVERPDGIRLNVHPHPQPFFDASGKVAGAINMLLDITEQKRANQELIEKNKELEQFVYVASHDLQEPLNTIGSFVSLLETEAGLNGEMAEYLQFIKASSDRMIHLVTDLLEYAKIGRQGKAQPVDCNALIQEVLTDMKATLENKQAVVNVGKLPKLEHAYATELRLLFQNLVSNAIKFQPNDSTPIINVSAKKEGLGWHFLVEDNGIGIDDKFKERVFIIFQRLHTTDEYEGTGVGLAHCKKIIDLHQGRLWLDSKVGVGSKFHFTIFASA